MKKFAFISDFDGTLTSRDFYHIMIDRYLGDTGKKYYTEWKKKNKINVEFLNYIFGAINLSEEQLLDDIRQIPIDEYAKDFVSRVKNNNGDFYIVSAGTSYYIELLLKYLDIKDVKVISMKGEYANRGIKITADTNNIFYSEVFGIDKRKVVESMRNDYEKIIFAGDSEPDLEAAKAADIVYARGELAELLKNINVNFTTFSNFKQIEDDLVEKGFLNENTST